MALPTPYDVTFPIDVVYTWVDGDDPEWNAARQAAGRRRPASEAAGQARFRSRDELLHSLRQPAPLRAVGAHIHLVTAGQRPAWLADDAMLDGRVRVVDHREILPADALPTFNSQAIETALHRIPGLAEHFVYVNDDVFLGRPTRPELFFSPGGAFAAFVGDATIGLPGTADKPFLHAAANNRALHRGRLRGRDHPGDGPLPAPAPGVGARRGRGPLPRGRRPHRRARRSAPTPTSRCCPRWPSTTG